MRTLAFEELRDVSGGLVQATDDFGSGFGVPVAGSIMDQMFLLETQGNDPACRPEHGTTLGETSGGGIKTSSGTVTSDEIAACAASAAMVAAAVTLMTAGTGAKGAVVAGVGTFAGCVTLAAFD